MERFTRLTGIVAPLDRVNVDTDQVIPAVYLKRIERTGYGEFLFAAHRYNPDGSPNPEFVLNVPAYKNASILISGHNFGCGSSREHAPWALLDFGFRCVIAPSFADIFYSNCFQNGILPVTLAEETVREFMDRALAKPGSRLKVDLEAQQVADEDEELVAAFDVDPFRRQCLLKGLDDIGLTLGHEDKIAAYEARMGI